MQNKEEKVKARIISAADNGLDAIENYFGGTEDDLSKISMAFKILSQATKILHMNQVKTLTERSQALRLLPWLANDEQRTEYIRATNPQAGPLLMARPSKNHN